MSGLFNFPSLGNRSSVPRMSAVNSSGQTLTNNTTTIITNWTAIYDTHSAFNAATGTFTVPITGYYVLEANLTATGTAASNFATRLVILMTSRVMSSFAIVPAISASAFQVGGTAAGATILNRGDTVQIQCVQVSGNTATLSTDSTINNFSISMLANQY